MNAPIRTAVIGMGSLGRRRASMLAAHPDFTLSALCDPQPPAAPETFAVPHYADWRTLLAQEPLDAVFVCATNDVLTEITCAALERGLHVFCEKPPGRTLAEIETMAQAEHSAGRVLKFGFNHRYHPSVEQAYALIRSGEYGDLLWMRGVYGKSGGPNYEKGWRNDPVRSGGGILIDQGIHMLDLMRWFAGDLRVVAGLKHAGYWPSPVEDNAMLLLQSTSGIMAQLHSSATQW